MSIETTPPLLLPAPDAAVVPVSRRSPLPMVATVVSLIALATALTQPLWVGQLYPAPAASDNSALVQQIAQLQQRIEALESKPAPMQEQVSAPVDLSPLEARLHALETRPVAADTSGLEKTIAQMRHELGEGNKADHAQKTLLVAALQLTSAWQSGQAFEAPWLTALAAAAVADPALATDLDDAAPTLLRWRDKGIPTLAKLSADYPAMAQAAVVAGTPKGEGWWQQSLARVEGLVTIRRQGEAVAAEDTANDAVLARAETRLKTGDLASAVAELEKLDETTSAATADWLAGARARLLVDALATKMTQRAAGALLADGSTAQIPPSDTSLPLEPSSGQAEVAP